MEKLAGNGFPQALSSFPEVEAEVEVEVEAAAAAATGEEADPFSGAGYLYPEANTIITPKQKQKLRPIRSNGGNRSDALLTVTGGGNPSELGFEPLEEFKSEMDVDAHFVSNNLNHQHSHLCDSSFSGCESESREEVRKARRKRRRKRKMEEYVKELMGQVMERQEQMQQQLMEVIEKKEKERVGREEAWRQQERVRLKEEHQIRSQEAARSLALISFLRNALGLPDPDFQLPLYSHLPS